jgi:hypothetical protein
MCDFTSDLISLTEQVSVDRGNETFIPEEYQGIIKNLSVKMMKHPGGNT